MHLSLTPTHINHSHWAPADRNQQTYIEGIIKHKRYTATQLLFSTRSLSLYRFIMYCNISSFIVITQDSHRMQLWILQYRKDIIDASIIYDIVIIAFIDVADLNVISCNSSLEFDLNKRWYTSIHRSVMILYAPDSRCLSTIISSHPNNTVA